MLLRFRPLTGPLVPLVLALSLSGCQAIYDDTKGWANRVEASVMKAAKDFGKNNRRSPANGPSGVEWVGEEDPVASAPGSDPGSASGSRPGLVQETAASMVTAKQAPAPAKAETEAVGPGPQRKAPAKQQMAAVMDPTGPVADPGPTPPPLPKLKPTKAAAKAPKTAEAEAQQKPADKAAMVIHLSSLRSEKAAKKEWEALKRAFPEQLSAMSPSFARTEIAERGTFYRVLAGPLPSKQAARQICGALKAKKQYCQVMAAPPSA